MKRGKTKRKKKKNVEYECERQRKVNGETTWVCIKKKWKERRKSTWRAFEMHDGTK